MKTNGLMSRHFSNLIMPQSRCEFKDLQIYFNIVNEVKVDEDFSSRTESFCAFKRGLNCLMYNISLIKL